MKSVQWISTITILVILFSLGFFYRHLSAVVMIGVPLIMGIMWTLGFMGLTLGHLNIITAFLVGILFGLGIDVSIHMYTRYHEDRKEGLSIASALNHMLLFAGRSCFISTLTTTTVFYSLMLSDFKGFSEFGYMAGTGVLFAYFALVFMLPPLLVYAEKFGFFEIRSN